MIERLLTLLLLATFAAASEPSPAAPPVTVEAVAAAAEGEYLMIDVRSQMEWEIMRIPGGRNLPAGSIREGDLLDLRAPNSKPIMCFYANGAAGEVLASQAAAAAAKLGFKHVVWLEGGVQRWSDRFPSRTLFLDKPLDHPSVESLRMSRERFAEAVKTPAVFLEAAGSGQVQVLDVRQPHQRVKKGLLPGRPILLTPDDFLWSLRRNAIVANEKVFIADYDGTLLPWLQYHLVRFGVEKYAFLRGGQRALETASAAKTN